MTRIIETIRKNGYTFNIYRSGLDSELQACLIFDRRPEYVLWSVWGSLEHVHARIAETIASVWPE